MWRNYLTVGARALAKNRVYAGINIAGLAIGMAACLLILLYVRYERSYDVWLLDSADAYQVQSWYHDRDTGRDARLQMTPIPTKPALVKDFPQIEKAVYFYSTEPTWKRGGEVEIARDFIMADGNLLDIVKLPVVAGSARALDQLGTAAITRREAMLRFGTDQVVGRSFTVISRGEERSFRIVAVLADLPKNTHLKIATIGRIDLDAVYAKDPEVLTCWGCQNGWLYLRLKPGTDPKSLEAQFPAWEKRAIPDDTAGGDRVNAGESQDWHLAPLRGIHLGPAQDASMTPGNDRRTIVTFSVIALLILGMACVNFTNLSTARASQRAREVALRKVLGADRRDLIVQFLAESIVLSLVAMLIALALVELCLPAYAGFLDADLKLTYFGVGGVLLPAVLLSLCVGLASGVYPAFFLSRFQPAQVLKANKSSAEAQGTGRLRNLLVIGQFAVSIGLIICTAVVYLQTIYARSVDPGFRRDHILQVEGLSRFQLITRGEAIAEAVARVPGVLAVGRTTIGVATTNNSNSNMLVPGRPKGIGVGQYNVDRGFKDAMGLTLVSGRWFDQRQMDEITPAFPPDPKADDALVARGGNVVLNELAVKQLGFTPRSVLGRTFRDTRITSRANDVLPVTVIGVVKDSRFRTVRRPIDPIVFMNSRMGQSELIVRFDGNPAAVRAGVERAWKRIAPDVPFEAKFSEEIMGELYRAEDGRAKSFAGFAFLSMVIGCLGLFGLAAFTAERRTKEIGIRKVLGARTQDIVRLLVWQFSRPVLVANLIAWPIAWWVMRGWLNGFDDRIGLGPAPFLGAGLVALLIAVATIGGHAMRVAQASPIRALRYE